MTVHGSGTRFTDEEFTAFVARTLEDGWEASHDGDTLHDVSITHTESAREILIDSARNRVSYRDTETGEWGIQQKQVSDLDSAVTTLQTVAFQVPMNEMHYLGIDGHPDPPGKQ